MRRVLVGLVLLLGLVSANNTFAQNLNASVGGFVQDITKAYIPGVTITATNTQTGVVTSVLSNETGAYNVPSLLPGTYKLSAELPGFRPQIYNDVQLGGNTAARVNFTLQVGAATQAVEVTSLSTSAISESSATIGQVLTEQRIRDLPLVSTNVLDLMRTMAGVRGEISSTATTFAGISASSVNTTRDGLSVQEGRYAFGVGSTTLINPDMVAEMRVILTPVDAETGRGNGQVQILTKSGTNKYTGSVVWNVRNSALNSNTWSNNKQIVRGEWSPGKPNWQNENEYTVAFGGPIVKNKTFFFALWGQQFERDRTQMRPVVLTECAKNGIFRYWDSWVNGNINTVTNAVGANPTRASVDSFGNPAAPASNPNGSPVQLRYFSVFGPLLNTPTRPDCSDAVVSGAPWDANRSQMDPVGISQRYLALMPQANRFDGGDGLNTAVHQWAFAAHGTGDLDTAYGTSFEADHQQINIKVDHNINSRHKVAANYSYQWVSNDYIPVSGPTTQWPGGYPSKTIRRPRVFTVNFTSTLTPSMVNEGRFGYRANWHYVWAPWEVPDEKLREVPLSLMLQGGGGYPIAYTPATVGGMTTVGFSCMTGCAQQGNNSPLFDYSDTLSWARGKHAFKGGVDFRFAHSRGYETPTAPIPKAFGGAGTNTFQGFSNAANFPGLVSTNQTLANSLLYFLAGSVGSAQQYYYMGGPTQLTSWNSYLDHTRKLTDAHQNDFSLFFKDDWKVRPSFTLNLGVRYEYYGVPYEGSGLTPAPEGGGAALFGISGRGFDHWMRPDNPVDLNLLVKMELVGPNSPNPDKSLYKDDWNNFGPAVGFAWQLPWFGKGKTNVRGGYQVSYSKGSNISSVVNAIFLNPGFLNLAQTAGPTDGSYFDLRNLPSLVPIPPSTLPLEPIPLKKPTQSLSVYDPNFTTPYIQNFTLSVTRDLSRTVSLDVRYIGTRGLKLDGNFDLNSSNVFYNPVLFDALERTRKGEDVPLFDQMFMGLSFVAGQPVVNGTTQRGSNQLRLNTTFRTNLANGDYEAVSNSLNTYNGANGALGTVSGTAGERGTVLRRANRGFNVTGGTTIAGGPVVPAGLFPENWIAVNPQVNAASYYTNTGKSNYHSVQAQATLRPTLGLSFQGTYIWSKSMSLSASTYTNPADRDKDYGLSSSHVTHEFRSNGTFALPIGPNKLFFGNSSGWIARAIEGWQTSVIINLSTGQPTSVGGGNMLYGNGVADIVGPLPADRGHVQWNGAFGSYFDDDTFGKVSDPQCDLIAASLRSFCSLQAVTDARTGQIVLQNPQPGKRGSLGRQTMELPGSWNFDTAMSKSFRINESKSLQIRMDATNVFNHPVPSSPSVSINGSNPFGFIQSKGNQTRQFKGQLRLSF